MYNIFGLKKYFGIGANTKDIPKSELLNSNESLKHFGTLWNYHKDDVLMMLTVLEYEFISRNNYSEDQVAAIKTILGETGKFFKQCGSEWSDYERKQAKSDL